MPPSLDDPTHAFATLGPDEVLNSVETLGFRCNGHQLALNSYENRVYQVGIEDQPPVIAKFYRPGRWSDDAILEEHAFAAELASADIPIVPPLDIAGRTLHEHGPFRLSISPSKPGRSPELDDLRQLEQVGRLVARIHLLGELTPFASRPALDVESFGERSADYLLDNGVIPTELEAVYDGLAEHLLDAIDACYDRAGSIRTIRLHGDLHPGNVLAQDESFYIVDLDDARSGPAIQDLWMFLSGDQQEQGPQLHALLDGYTQFRSFDGRELQLIEALRTLRIMHYAAWLARRWADPAFQVAFPWFESRRYWDDHVLALREQLALMSEPPLAWQP